MLYALLFPLSDLWSVLNVFQYITFRAAGATVTALLLSIFLGPPVIRWLRQLSIGQSIREEGPESHQAKASTPHTQRRLGACRQSFVGRTRRIATTNPIGSSARHFEWQARHAGHHYQGWS